jgi:hypothetical protein
MYLAGTGQATVPQLVEIRYLQIQSSVIEGLVAELRRSIEMALKLEVY